MVITILHHYLFETCNIGKSAETLYMWADNCARENKNYYVISFLALLVHYGYFSCVEFNFNVVGHTHTKIDGLHGSQKGRLFGKKRKNDHLGCLDEIVQCLCFFWIF